MSRTKRARLENHKNWFRGEYDETWAFEEELEYQTTGKEERFHYKGPKPLYGARTYEEYKRITARLGTRDGSVGDNWLSSEPSWWRNVTFYRPDRRRTRDALKALMKLESPDDYEDCDIEDFRRKGLPWYW